VYETWNSWPRRKVCFVCVCVCVCEESWISCLIHVSYRVAKTQRMPYLVTVGYTPSMHYILCVCSCVLQCVAVCCVVHTATHCRNTLLQCIDAYIVDRSILDAQINSRIKWINPQMNSQIFFSHHLDPPWWRAAASAPAAVRPVIFRQRALWLVDLLRKMTRTSRHRTCLISDDLYVSYDFWQQW